MLAATSHANSAALAPARRGLLTAPNSPPPSLDQPTTGRTRASLPCTSPRPPRPLHGSAQPRRISPVCKPWAMALRLLVALLLLSGPPQGHRLLGASRKASVLTAWGSRVRALRVATFGESHSRGLGRSGTGEMEGLNPTISLGRGAPDYGNEQNSRN